MKDYQEALRIMYELLGKIPYEVELSDLNPLSELVNEKLEQESRKDKLVEGSKWVCDVGNKAQEFGNYKPHVENIKKGLIVEVFDVNGLIIFGHNKSMESWVVGEEQFLACFKPIKEGDKDER